MDKIKITINGNSFEAEGKDIKSIFDFFMKDCSNDEKQQKQGFPSEYKSYFDYLTLPDLNLPNTQLDDIFFEDFQKKLNNRVEYVKNNPNLDYDAVLKNFSDAEKYMNTHINIMEDTIDAYDMFLMYINDIRKVLGK